MKSHSSFVVFAILLLCLNSFVNSFRAFGINRKLISSSSIFSSKPSSPVVNEISFDIPLGDQVKPLTCKFRPIFANSTFIMLTYDVPFSLNVEKPPKNFPAPAVAKDGPEGKEKVGDLLRACTSWSQGFQAAGVTSDIAMFAGNIKWRKSVFDCTGAPWDGVVQALLSNTSERSKTVTLIFEREIEE